MSTISVNGIFNLQIIRDGEVVEEVAENNKILPSMEALLQRQFTTNLPFSIENISVSNRKIEYENDNDNDYDNYDSITQLGTLDGSIGAPTPLYSFKNKHITDDGKVMFSWEINGEKLISDMCPGQEKASVQGFALRALVYNENGSISYMDNSDNPDIFENVPVAQKSLFKAIEITKNDKLIGKWFIDFSLNN